jgi:hypothetical protein
MHDPSSVGRSSAPEGRPRRQKGSASKSDVARGPSVPNHSHNQDRCSDVQHHNACPQAHEEA